MNSPNPQTPLDQGVEIARRNRIQARGRLVEKHDPGIERAGPVIREQITSVAALLLERIVGITPKRSRGTIR
jgi:hypothetical protein